MNRNGKGVWSNNSSIAPSGPLAEAITDPEGYGYLATFTYDLLETYYASWGGYNGGRYRATAHLGSASLIGECYVWRIIPRASTPAQTGDG